LKEERLRMIDMEFREGSGRGGSHDERERSRRGEMQEEEEGAERNEQDNPYAQLSDVFCSLTAVKFLLDRAS